MTGGAVGPPQRNKEKKRTERYEELPYFRRETPRISGRGREPATRFEREPRIAPLAVASAERLRPVRLHARIARSEPLQGVRRGADRRGDRRLRPRREEIPGRGVSAGTVRSARCVGRRLRAADRSRSRGAHPLVAAAVAGRSDDRRGAGARAQILHQRRRVAREGSLGVERHGAGRGEARGGARGTARADRRRTGSLLREDGAGDERRRPARGGELFPGRGARSLRDGAADSGYLLERPLPPYDLYDGADLDSDRRVVHASRVGGVVGAVS